jgi:alginate O-acetyltransferase complex protein AlgI
VNVLLTLFLVAFGWVFFRSPNMRTAWHVCAAMLGRSATAPRPDGFLRQSLLPNQSLFVLSLAILLVALPALAGEERLHQASIKLRPLALALVPVGLVLSIAQLVNGGFTPLIYFKF